MNQNTKRLVLLNLPYVLMGLYATNLGYAWRLAVGADFSEKMMSLMGVLPGALGRIVPSFHPLDLAVGLCCGVGLRLAVYLKGKNAKKYRHGSEYGSARWFWMLLDSPTCSSSRDSLSYRAVILISSLLATVFTSLHNVFFAV